MLDGAAAHILHTPVKYVMKRDQTVKRGLVWALRPGPAHGDAMAWHGMAARMALARFIPRPWVQRPHAIPKRPPAAAGTCLDLVVAALSIAYPVPDTCSRGEPFILVSDLFFFVKSKSTTLHSARVRFLLVFCCRHDLQPHHGSRVVPLT